MGVIINRPLDITVGEMFEQLTLTSTDEAAKQQTLYLGGPVDNERGFVLHSAEKSYDGSTPLNASLTLTTSPDVLSAIAAGDGPEQHLIALGYAGWTAGQLEQEILDNYWLTSSGNIDIIFELPHDKRWEAAYAHLGISPLDLGGAAGHA